MRLRIPSGLWLPDADALFANARTLRARTTVSPTAGRHLACCIAVALFVSAVLTAPIREHSSWLVASGLILLLLRPSMDRKQRCHREGPNAPVASSLALVGVGALSVWTASFAIDVSGFRAEPLVPDAGPPKWFVVAFTTSPAIIALASGVASSSVGWFARGARLRWIARVAWAATAAMVCAALASRRAEFDKARYFEAQRQVATIRAGAQDFNGPRGDSTEVRVGGSVIRTAARASGYCAVFVEPRGPRRLGAADDFWDAQEFVVPCGEPVELRFDAARSMLLLRYSNGRISARDVRDGRLHDLSAADLREFAGPPHTWISGALLGLIIAAIALRRSKESVSHTVAMVREGHAHLDDGRSLRVVPPPGFEGAALIRGDVALTSAYRDGDIELARVIEGTPDDLAAATNAARVTRDAVALSTLALTSAPLWTAALRGLVFA